MQRKHLSSTLPFLIASLLILVLGNLATTSADNTKSANPFRTSFGQPVHAQSVSLELVSQLGGATKAVAVQGDYAYIGVGPRLVILDISDRNNPMFLGQTAPLPEMVRSVSISGTQAFIANGQGGLRVINTSDPANPTEVGSFDTPGDAYSVAVSGTVAYVADYTSGMTVIDISNPLSPTRLTTFYSSQGGKILDVAIADRYAYVLDDDRNDITNALLVVDISNPISPTEVGADTTLADFANGLALNDHYAYVATGPFGGVNVVDIFTPTNPTRVGTYGGISAEDVIIEGTSAYVASGNTMVVLDLTDPITPSLAVDYDVPGNMTALAVAGSYAYGTNDLGALFILDITAPDSPAEAGTFTTVAGPRDIALAGDYAFLADYAAGLRIVNISNPATPTLLSSYDTPGLSRGVASSGNYVFATDYDDLRIFDVSDPSAPVEAGSAPEPIEGVRVAVSGNRAYVTDNDQGTLRVFDITSPDAPSQLGYLSGLGSDLNGIAITGTKTFIAEGGGIGLRVVDVSNPITPTQIISYNTTGTAYDVAISGHYAYVADYFQGLRIIDIANLGALTEIGSYDTSGYAYGVAVTGTHAFVADGPSGLRILDVSNPATPSEVAFYDTAGEIGESRGFNRVKLVGNYAYVVSQESGLWIFHYTLPDPPIPTPTSTVIASPTAPRTATPVAAETTPTVSPSSAYKVWLPLVLRSFGGW